MKKQYSSKTKIAIEKYGIDKCIAAYKRYDNGTHGAKTIGYEMGVTTNQADAMINAGEEILTVSDLDSK